MNVSRTLLCFRCHSFDFWLEVDHWPGYGSTPVWWLDSGCCVVNRQWPFHINAKPNHPELTAFLL